MLNRREALELQINLAWTGFLTRIEHAEPWAEPGFCYPGVTPMRSTTKSYERSMH